MSFSLILYSAIMAVFVSFEIILSSPFLKFNPKTAYCAGEKHKPRKGISQTERGHTQHKAIGQHGNYSTQSAKSKEFLQKIFYFSSFCNFIKEIKSVLM